MSRRRTTRSVFAIPIAMACSKSLAGSAVGAPTNARLAASRALATGSVRWRFRARAAFRRISSSAPRRSRAANSRPLGKAPVRENSSRHSEAAHTIGRSIRAGSRADVCCPGVASWRTPARSRATAKKCSSGARAARRMPKRSIRRRNRPFRPCPDSVAVGVAERVVHSRFTVQRLAGCAAHTKSARSTPALECSTGGRANSTVRVPHRSSTDRRS